MGQRHGDQGGLRGGQYLIEHGANQVQNPKSKTQNPTIGTDTSLREHETGRAAPPLRLVIKQFVLPTEHGGWILWLGPFLLGALAAARPDADLLLLFLLILAGFLSRQSMVMATKSLAGRRARADLRPALQVLAVIGGVALLLLAALAALGNGYLLWLGLPAAPVLAWQLWLVSRRQERQRAVELVGSGVLALAAPAAYWVSLGHPAATGWWLWALAWLYNASAVVYVYLRLQQRRLKMEPPPRERVRLGTRTLAYAGANILIAAVLAALRFVPLLAPLPYALALAHFMYGIGRPATGARPAQIGAEQSTATLVFFLLLGVTFHL